MTDLLPCPFCGGKAEEEITDSGLRLITCSECFVQASGHSFREVEPTWNRRVEPPIAWRSMSEAPKDREILVLLTGGYGITMASWVTDEWWVDDRQCGGCYEVKESDISGWWPVPAAA